jgi:hypothetical protein
LNFCIHSIVRTAQYQSVENNTESNKAFKYRSHADFDEQVLGPAVLVAWLDFNLGLLLKNHELYREPLPFCCREQPIFQEFFFLFVKSADYHSNKQIEEEKTEYEYQKHVQDYE